jgi:hypothetical protein
MGLGLMFRCVHPRFPAGFYEDVDTFLLEFDDPPDLVCVGNSWRLADGSPVLVLADSTEAAERIKVVHESRGKANAWGRRDAMVWDEQNGGYTRTKVTANLSVGTRTAIYRIERNRWAFAVLAFHHAIVIDEGRQADMRGLGNVWNAYLRRHYKTFIPHQSSLEKIFVELDSTVREMRTTHTSAEMRDAIHASKPYAQLKWRNARMRKTYERELTKAAKKALRDKKIRDAETDTYFFSE